MCKAYARVWRAWQHGPVLAMSSVWGAVSQAVGSFVGGERRNRHSRKEGRRQRAFNSAQAQLNRDFQERMSSTSHQREVADLKAAGLNPILSVNKGASSPGGSSASSTHARVEDSISPAISTAMQARRLKADLALIKQNTKTAEANETVLAVEQQKKVAEMDKTNAERRLLDAALPEASTAAELYTRGNSDILKLMEKFGITGNTATSLLKLLKRGK